jgi:hypothetical protein
VSVRFIATAVPQPPRVRLSILAAAWLGWASVLVPYEADAQAGVLDAPMQPVEKSGGAPSRCVQCPPAHAKDVETRRAGDRTAPEYAATGGESGRGEPTGLERDPPEALGDVGLSGGAGLPVGLPVR